MEEAQKIIDEVNEEIEKQKEFSKQDIKILEEKIKKEIIEEILNKK